jgi:hypothetical protein
MKHIKTPIKGDRSTYGSRYYLVDAVGLLIVSTPEWTYTESALKEIALAVNAHDALVEACELVLDELDKGTTSGRGGFSPYENRRCQDALRAALAKVRGEGE